MDMKRALPGKVALAVLTLASLVAAPIQAQPTGPGPYYAMPSWDQTLPMSSRFIVLSNFDSEGVLDRETGLVWQRTPDQTRAFLARAQADCIRFSPGGKYGWRLPTMGELTSLFVAKTCKTPLGDSKCYALPDGHPFILPNGLTGSWSATTAIRGGEALDYYGLNDLLAVGGLTAFTGSTDVQTTGSWCVRGPSSLQ
jgi:hypothetical protein